VTPKLQLVSSTAHAKKASATAIQASAFSKYAYVHGGSSARVGKAITALGKKLAKQPASSQSQSSQSSKGSTGTHVASSGSTWTPATTVTPGTFDPGDNACQSYSVCTPEEDCAIWGYNCSLLELPQLTPPATQPDPVAEPGPGGGVIVIDPIELQPVEGSLESSALVSSDEEMYEDC
jgi:hypothetical protein